MPDVKKNNYSGSEVSNVEELVASIGEDEYEKE